MMIKYSAGLLLIPVIAFGATGECSKLGASSQGGLCVSTGKGALIVSTQDAPEPTTWAGGEKGFSYHGATSTVDGRSNANVSGISSAIDYCSKLSQSGFDDWYLPSRNELYQLSEAKVANFDLSGASYWSSSEISYTYAWAFDFLEDKQISEFKDKKLRVRCVRRGR